MKGSRGFVKCWDAVIQQSRVFGPLRCLSLTHTDGGCSIAGGESHGTGREGIDHRVFVLLENDVDDDDDARC
jgi:hypothetical protein